MWCVLDLAPLEIFGREFSPSIRQPWKQPNDSASNCCSCSSMALTRSAPLLPAQAVPIPPRYTRRMHSATAQAHPSIAFIK